MAGFKFEILVPSDVYDYTFKRSTSSATGLNYSIDWGDGNQDTGITANTQPVHRYATAGLYIVEITGTCPGAEDMGTWTELKRIVAWGDKPTFAGFSAAPLLFNNTSIERIEDGSIILNNENNQGFSDFCNGCTELTYVGEGIFDIVGDQIVNLNSAFRGTKLSNIHPGMFDNCTNPNLLICSSIFENSLLKYIPVSLFDALIYATTFSYAFHNTPIKEIPNALFDKNIAANDFTNTFALCPLAKINPYIFYGPEVNEIFTHTKETRFLNKTVNFSGLFGSTITTQTGITPFSGIIISDYIAISSIGFGGGGGASTNSTANTNGPSNSGRGGGGCYNNGTPGKGGSGFIGIRYFDGADYQQVNIVDVGYGSWLIPTGVTEIELLLVAGGGGGSGYASTNGHGGGGGGIIFKHSLHLSDMGYYPGDSIPYTLGDGGLGAISNSTDGSNGSNSLFGSLTSFGGAGGAPNGGSSYVIKTGGSGGGGRQYSASSSNNNGLSRQSQGSNGKHNTSSPYLSGGGGSQWIKANDNNILPDLWNCAFGTGSASNKQIASSGINKYNTLNYIDLPTTWGGLSVKFNETIYQVSETELIARCENVISDRFSIFEQGFVYSGSPNPTILDSKISFEKEDVNRFDQIIGKISNLTADSTIYIRSYFTNEYGTFYGDNNEIELSTENIAQGFEFEISVTTENSVFALSTQRIASTTIDFLIDWGNNILESYKDNTPPTKLFESVGLYTVKLYGDCYTISGFSNNQLIKRIINWGKKDTWKGISNFPSFASSAIQRIEDGSFYYYSETPSETSIASKFSECSLLEYIGEGIFDNLSNITNASLLFENCIGLKSINYRIFDSMVNVTTFLGVLSGCTNLRYLAEGLFDKNIAVNTFSEALRNCNKLSNIEYLFYGPEVNEIFTHTKETRFLNKTVNFSGLFGPTTYSFNSSYADAINGKYLGDIFPGYGKDGYFSSGGNGTGPRAEYNSFGRTAKDTNPLPNTGCGASTGTLNTRKGASGVVLIRYKNQSDVYVIDAFTDLGAGFWDRPVYVNFIDVLIVGGGGAAATTSSGGGGGGGLIFKEDYDVRALGSSISVYVGDGGSAGQNNGQNSSFGSLVAIGGGYGGVANGAVGNGGSGGGCSPSYSTPWNPGVGAYNQGTQGKNPTSAGLTTSGGGGAEYSSLREKAYPDLWNCNFGSGTPSKVIVPWYGNRANITNYDIIPSDWGGNPILSNLSVNKVSDTDYEIDVDLAEWEGDYYIRIISMNDNVEVYNETGLHHEFSFELSALKKNYKAELMLEYAEGIYTAIFAQYFGQTFSRTIAIDPDFYIGEFAVNLGYQNARAGWIHGSYLYNGYWYGVPRKEMGTVSMTKSLLVRVPIDNYQNWEYIDIATSEYDSILYNGESLCRIGNYLFASMPVYAPNLVGYEIQNPLPYYNYLIIIDTVSFTHKLIPFSNTGGLVYSDGEFLYVGYDNFSKIDPTPFISAFSIFQEKVVLSEEDISMLTSGLQPVIYDSSTQGGYIDFPREDYLSTSKGYVHSAVVDANYVYLAYTTGINRLSGYDPESIMKGIHELHVVNKHTMAAAGWCYIPKATDDMTQNDTHLFLGVEVQARAPIETYGYGWGAFAVKKSNVINIDHSSGYIDPVKSLRSLYFNDNPPFVGSYASLIFGNYLLDFKTNKKVYIVDISDVDNWSFSDPIGSRTHGFIDFTINGNVLSGIPNEAAVDTNGKFHAFVWKNPSGAMRWDITEINPFSVPTINTLTADVEGYDVTMNGYVLNENGQPVTERGFRWGVNNDPETWVDSFDIGLIGSFEHLETFSAGTYYYQAYAINSQGTGYGSVQSFVVSDPYSVPSIDTSAAVVAELMVTLSGAVTDDGGQSVISRGFEWGTVSDPSGWTDFEVIPTPGDFEAILEFAIGTFYYRAYAVNSQGTGYGDVVQFIVENPYELPTVSTVTPSISGLNATLKGSVTNDGGAEITQRGFEWGSNSDPESWIESQSISLEGAFSLTDEFAEGIWYYRAFAENAQGIAYGEVVSFETIAEAVVPTVASNTPAINLLTVLLKGTVSSNGGTAITQRGFKIGVAPDDLTTTHNIGTSGAFEKSVELTSGTYYFEAFATNSEGTSYGEILSFEISDTPPSWVKIYFNSQIIQKIYIGDFEITSIK